MKPFLSTVAALGLSVAAVAVAQTAPPDTPATVPPMPTAPGQPAAPTSPAEMGRPVVPSGTHDTRPQTAQPSSTTPAAEPPAPRVQRAGSVEYLSGGAGAESRAAIELLQGRFALRNVFSGQGGEYVVPEKVIVRGAAGPATEIANAGPMLMLALPPGRYTIEAAVGGKVQTRTVTLTGKPVQLNWSWPGA